MSNDANFLVLSEIGQSFSRALDRMIEDGLLTKRQAGDLMGKLKLDGPEILERCIPNDVVVDVECNRNHAILNSLNELWRLQVSTANLKLAVDGETVREFNLTENAAITMDNTDNGPRT